MNWNCKSMLASCAVLLLAGTNLPAQSKFVEVQATIDVTTWRYHEETGLPLKASRNFSVRCVVGTNMWLIENNSQTNGKESVWFVNSKIIRQFSAPQDSIAEDPGLLPTRRGGRFGNFATSEDGYPSGDMSLTLPWFAFCSGPYFKRPGRAVPLPVCSADQPPFGFKDETIAFEDSLGLPQRVDLHTSKRQLKCEYRVQQSTNVLGWHFPTAFTLVQNEPGQFDQWRRQLAATGRVISIRRASKPELPPEIQARLDFLERYPSRRR